jgi:predicted transcriptional regulator
MLTFGAKMRIMRAARDISQWALWKATEVSAGKIARCELERYTMTQDEERKIRQELRWPPEGDAILEQVHQIGCPK